MYGFQFGVFWGAAGMVIMLHPQPNGSPSCSASRKSWYLRVLCIGISWKFVLIFLGLLACSSSHVVGSPFRPQVLNLKRSLILDTGGLWGNLTLVFLESYPMECMAGLLGPGKPLHGIQCFMSWRGLLSSAVDFWSFLSFSGFRVFFFFLFFLPT